MELINRSHEKITALIKKGVDIPNPLTLDIGDEVDIDRISHSGVKIYPGCRIYGRETVVSAGCRIGLEGPVTIDNCQLGPGVELKGGYFKKSLFLEKANMALGAHVREGCIMEEEANGAHCVGLKQTILFPFVTLGSLINFCDCLMAGGTSRKDHSEVGSSYIHFNFTPDGNKTTPSLIGDVPRGVMLNQPPIFLGGQGGIVGPLMLGYGNVVAAGSILREDLTEDKKLIIGKTYPGTIMNFTPHTYNNLPRVVRNNIIYISNLAALEQWYMHVRRPFFSAQEFGDLMYAGALDKLALAGQERIKRLKALVEKVPAPHGTSAGRSKLVAGRAQLRENIDRVCALFTENDQADPVCEYRDRFLAGFHKHKKHTGGQYVEVVQKMPAEVSQNGVLWLQHFIDAICGKAAEALPALNMFKNLKTS